jgi:hypothetical protein
VDQEANKHILMSLKSCPPPGLISCSHCWFWLPLLISVHLPSILAPGSMFPLEISLPASNPSLGFIFPLERTVSYSFPACFFCRVRVQGLAFGFCVARSKLGFHYPVLMSLFATCCAHPSFLTTAAPSFDLLPWISFPV